MLLKIRRRMFLNELEIQIQEPKKSAFTMLLKDERGAVCRALEVATETDQHFYKWYGLDDLPYGIYTCEISGAIDEMKTQVVKRI